MKDKKNCAAEIIDLLAALTLADVQGAYSTTQPKANINPFKKGDVVVINYRARDKGQIVTPS